MISLAMTVNHTLTNAPSPWRSGRKAPAATAAWVLAVAGLWVLTWRGVVSNWNFALICVASVFIVPTSQGPDDIAAARVVAGDGLRIIPVATLDEALKALADIGGNGLTLGTPGVGFKPS